MFVHEDDIAEAVKHFHSFSDELMKAAKANAPKGVEPDAPTTVSCAVMDNKVLSPAEVRRAGGTREGGGAGKEGAGGAKEGREKGGAGEGGQRGGRGGKRGGWGGQRRGNRAAKRG